MQRNFQAIDASFGNAGGGCDMYHISIKFLVVLII